MGFTSSGRRRIAVGLGIALGGAGALVGSTAQGAFQVMPTIKVDDYVTGFTPVNRVGPTGLAFGPGGRLWVSAAYGETLYRLPAGGGSIAGHALPSDGLGIGVTSLAFGASGTLFAARQPTQDIVAVDPGTGSPTRVVGTGIPCPLGMAVDPVTEDLFVSGGIGCAEDQGSNGAQPSQAIYRVSNPESASPTTSVFARLPEGSDGLTFSPDGTIYASLERHVASISGPSSDKPGQVKLLTEDHIGDGIAYARNPGGKPYLLVNTERGTLVQIPLDGSGTQTELASGGSRGDLATVGPDGCFYADQSDRVVRVSVPGVACPLDPPPGPSSSAVLGAQAVAAEELRCTDRRLVLTNVHTRGSRVLLQGVAKPQLAGQTVKLRFRATGRQVATAQVRKDGTFSTTAPRPPRSVRATNRARYQASIGSERSRDLKLQRRMDIDSITSGNGRVRIVGRIEAPLTKPVGTIELRRRVSCSKTVKVKTLRPNKNGVFRTTVAGPPNTQAATYRLMTYVRKRGAKRTKPFPTFTLPRVVSLP